jgi:hypothetical protein
MERERQARFSAAKREQQGSQTAQRVGAQAAAQAAQTAAQQAAQAAQAAAQQAGQQAAQAAQAAQTAAQQEVFSGIICLILQLTLIGWLPAARPPALPAAAFNTLEYRGQIEAPIRDLVVQLLGQDRVGLV